MVVTPVILSHAQWAGAYFWLDELSNEVWWYLGHQGQCGNYPQCSNKSQNSGFLRKSFFFDFRGPQKTFLTPRNLIWPYKPQLKFLGVKKVFWGPQNQKKMIFSKNPNSVICPNTLLKIHSPSNVFGTILVQSSQMLSRQQMIWKKISSVLQPLNTIQMIP